MVNNILRKSWDDLIFMSPRFMGTPGEKKAVKYISDTISNLDLNVTPFPFDYEGWEFRNNIALNVTYPTSKNLNPLTFLGSGSSKEINGKVIYLGETVIWNMYNWNRFAIVNDQNQITGYITGRSVGGALSQTLSEMSLLPHFIIGEEDSNFLLNKLTNSEEIRVSGYLEARRTGKQTGDNVIVRFPSDNRKKKIIFCAHYDTMFNTLGAYDNTSGTAVLLGLAEFLRDKKLNKSVELVFMGAEEWSLAGSKSYVNQLSQEEKDNIELVVNIDGLGRGDVFEAWVGPELVERDMFTFFHESNITTEKKVHFKCPPPPGSDHTPFFDAGIPVCMFTINDQDIIHTSKDVPQDSIYQNMLFCMDVIKKFLNYKGIL